jgi:hypothetical protein
MRHLMVFGLSLVAGCQSVERDIGPLVPTVEVRALRLRPEKPLVTLGHHDNRSFIEVTFSVIAPEEHRGRTLTLKFMPEFPGKLFEFREFRLRFPQNVIEGKNRERRNPDGTTSVWADSDTHWNFESVMVEAIERADAPEPTP